jgi:hypothetical protein
MLLLNAPVLVHQETIVEDPLAFGWKAPSMVTASSNPEPDILEPHHSTDDSPQQLPDVSSALHELQPDALGWGLLLRRAAASLAFVDPLAAPLAAPIFDANVAPLLVPTMVATGVLGNHLPECNDPGDEHAVGFVDGASVLDLSSSHLDQPGPENLLVQNLLCGEENNIVAEELVSEEELLEGAAEEEIQPCDALSQDDSSLECPDALSDEDVNSSTTST